MKPSLVVIIAVIVISAIFLLARSKTPPDVATPQNINQAQTPTTSDTIQYTKKGFVPSTISVKIGTTVTFSNVDGGELWIASTPHPAHTDYPGFDQGTFIKNGQQYTFAFTKAGNWTYHNHLVSSDTGTVVVTP